MFCRHCGAEINENAVVCVKCGCAVYDNAQTTRALNPTISDKDWLITAILAFFLGYLGAHRFYVGKIGSAILMLITFGGCGIWWLIDFLVIISEKFTDDNGKIIKNTKNY